MESWLEVLETGKTEYDPNESERVAFEALICFRQILSEESLKKYCDKMSEVVELEKDISESDLEPEKEYRRHLESAGVCLKALSIPLREHTSYDGSAEELKQIGKFFQIVDDIQDLDEDSYFPDMSRNDARKKMREIQVELSGEIGTGFSRIVMKVFGKYMPVLDDYIDFKKYV